MARYAPRTITKKTAALGYLLAGSVLACEDHQNDSVVTVEVVSTVYLDLDVCRNACSTTQALENNPAATQPTTTVDLTLPIYDTQGASATAYTSTKTADNKDCRGTVFHYQPTIVPYVTETTSHSEATHSIKTVQPTCEACSGTVWIYEPTGSACGSGSSSGAGSIAPDGTYPTATLSGAAAGSTTQTIYIPGHTPIVIVGDLPAVQSFPVDSATGYPKDPQTGRLIDPTSGLPLLIDPSTGCAVNPGTGLPLPGCAETIDPATGCAIDATTGRPLPGCLSALGPETGLTGDSNSASGSTSGSDSKSGSGNGSGSSGSDSISSSSSSSGSGSGSDSATCSVPKSSEADTGFTYGVYNIRENITDLMYIDALDFARPVQISKGLAPFEQSVDAKQPQVYNARAWIYVCDGGNYRFETPGVNGDVAFWIGENALNLLSPPAAQYCGTGSSQMLDPKFQVEAKESSTADGKASGSAASSGSSKDSTSESSYTYGCAEKNSLVVNVQPGVYTPVRVVCVLGSGKCLFRITNEQGEIMFDNTQGSIIQSESFGIFTERALDGSYPKKHPGFPEGSNSGNGLIKGKNPYEKDSSSRVTIIGDEDQDGRPDSKDDVSAVIIPSRESGRQGSDYQGFKTQVQPDDGSNVKDAASEVLGSSPSNESDNIELFDKDNSVVGYITPTGDILHRDGTTVTCAVYDAKSGKVIRYGAGGGDCQTGKKGDQVIDSFPDPTKQWNLTNKDEKVVGTITPSGEIRDSNKNIVKDHYLDPNTYIVVHTPSTAADKEKVIGSQLGSVSDGKLVKDGETVGSVNPSKDVLDTNGNVIHGVILDPKTSTVREPTFSSSSGSTGVIGSSPDSSDSTKLINNGQEVGSIDSDGKVKDKNGDNVNHVGLDPASNIIVHEVIGSSRDSSDSPKLTKEGEEVGSIGPNGEVLDKDGKEVESATLESNTVIPKPVNLTTVVPGEGKTDSPVFGSTTDASGNGNLVNNSGETVGSVTPSGDVLDTDGNVVPGAVVEPTSNVVIAKPVNLTTVVPGEDSTDNEVFGSSPSSPGSSDLVNSEGQVVGTIGPDGKITDKDGNPIPNASLDPGSNTIVKQPGDDTTSGSSNSPASGTNDGGSGTTNGDDVYGSTRDPASDSNLVKDGTVVGTINPDGTVKDKNGNEVPEAVFHPSLNFVIRKPRPSGGNGSGNGDVIGSSPQPSRNNNLVDDDENVVGSVKPNGEALDTNGVPADNAVLDPDTNQVVEGPKDDLSNDREVIGSSPDPSGKNNLLDKDGNIVGFIGDNGEIIDREGQPTDAVLDPETNQVVKGPKDDTSSGSGSDSDSGSDSGSGGSGSSDDFDSPVIGSSPDPAGNGNLVDEAGNVVGSVGPDGQIRDANNEPVNGAYLDPNTDRVVKSPTDDSGSGSGSNPGSGSGGSGSSDDFNNPVIGSSPDPSGNGNLVDESGNVVGSIGPDGEIRDVNNDPVDGASLDSDSNTVVRNPSSSSGSGGSGSSDDFNNPVIGSSPDPSGNGNLVDEAGNVVGSVDDDGTIRDEQGNPVDAALDPDSSQVVPILGGGSGGVPSEDIVDPAPGNTNQVIGSTPGPNGDLVDGSGNPVGSVDDDGTVRDSNGSPTDASLDRESNTVVPGTGGSNPNSGNGTPDQDGESGSGNGTSDGSTPIGSTPGGPSGNDLVDEAGNVVGSLGPDGQVTDVDGNAVNAAVDPATGTVAPTTPDSADGNANPPAGNQDENTTPGNPGDEVIDSTPGSPTGTDLINESGETVGASSSEGEVVDNNGSPVDAVVDPNTGAVTPANPGNNGGNGGNGDNSNSPVENGSSSTTPGNGGSGTGNNGGINVGDGANNGNDGGSPDEIDPATATGGGLTNPIGDDDDDDDNTPADNDGDLPVEIDPATGGGSVTNPTGDDDNKSSTGGSNNSNTPADANEESPIEINPATGGGITDPTSGDNDNNSTGDSGNSNTPGATNEDSPNEVNPATSDGPTDSPGNDDDNSTGDSGNGGAPADTNGDLPIEINPATGGGVANSDSPTPEQCNDPNSGIDVSLCAEVDVPGGPSAEGNGDANVDENGNVDVDAGGGVDPSNNDLPNIDGGAGGAGSISDGTEGAGAGGSGNVDGEAGQSGAGGSGSGSINDEGESGAGGAGEGEFEDDEGQAGGGGSGEFEDDEGESGAGGAGEGEFEDDEGQAGGGGSGEFEDDVGQAGGGGSGEFEDDEGQAGGGGSGEFEDDEGEAGGGGSGEFEDDEGQAGGGGSGEFEDDEEGESGGGGSGEFQDDEEGESGSGFGEFDDEEGESGGGGSGEFQYDDDEEGESGSGFGEFEDDEGESGSGGFGEGFYDDDEEEGESGGGTGFFKRRMARYI